MKSIMSVQRLRRLGLATALAVGVMAISTAAASAATLTTTVNTPTPEQGVPVQLTFSGTPDTSGYVYAVARPSGGVPCQANFAADQTAAGDASQGLISGDDGDYENGGAPFTVNENWTPGSIGSYIICAWIEPGDSESATPEYGPVTASLSARAPQVSVLTVSLPSTPVPGDQFNIDYTTQTDQQLSLASMVKPAGGLPCASSYELESENAVDSESDIFDGSRDVYGGPTMTTGTATEPAGNYLICTWIEGPNQGEVDAAITTPFSVPGPPPKVPKAAPTLAVTHLRAVTGHGVVIKGTTAAGLTGVLKVKVGCDHHVNSGSAIATAGKFDTSLPLPQGCRAGDGLTATVSWGGSSAFLKDEIDDTTIVSAPHAHHRLHHHRHRHQRHRHQRGRRR